METMFCDYSIQMLMFCQYYLGLDDKANRLSTGPSFKVCCGNCLSFLLFDQPVVQSIFSVYIYLQFHLLQSNCNNGYFSRTSFVNFLKGKYILLLEINFFFAVDIPSNERGNWVFVEYDIPSRDYSRDFSNHFLLLLFGGVNSVFN